jgi:hypothetical protein
MPASGLNGGVGKTTRPTLRPRALPTPINWPRAGTHNSREKVNNSATTVATLSNRLITAKLSSRREE